MGAFLKGLIRFAAATKDTLFPSIVPPKKVGVALREKQKTCRLKDFASHVGIMGTTRTIRGNPTRLSNMDPREPHRANGHTQTALRTASREPRSTQLR